LSLRRDELTGKWRKLYNEELNDLYSSSSSVGATTLGGFWPALRFLSTIFYLYTSLSSFSLSTSLNPLLLGQTIPILVFLMVLQSFFNDPACSPNIVRVIKSRRMSREGHVARMGKGETYTGFWWRNLRKRDHLEDPVLNGIIILRCVFRKWDVNVWTGSRRLRIGTGGGHL
jgi:hypothetical protein